MKGNLSCYQASWPVAELNRQRSRRRARKVTGKSGMGARPSRWPEEPFTQFLNFSYRLLKPMRPKR
jgi:hypothetical protein